MAHVSQLPPPGFPHAQTLLVDHSAQLLEYDPGSHNVGILTVVTPEGKPCKVSHHLAVPDPRHKWTGNNPKEVPLHAADFESVAVIEVPISIRQKAKEESGGHQGLHGLGEHFAVAVFPKGGKTWAPSLIPPLLRHLIMPALPSTQGPHRLTLYLAKVLSDDKDHFFIKASPGGVGQLPMAIYRPALDGGLLKPTKELVIHALTKLPPTFTWAAVMVRPKSGPVVPTPDSREGKELPRVPAAPPVNLEAAYEVDEWFDCERGLLGAWVQKNGEAVGLRPLNG